MPFPLKKTPPKITKHCKLPTKYGITPTLRVFHETHVINDPNLDIKSYGDIIKSRSNLYNL